MFLEKAKRNKNQKKPLELLRKGAAILWLLALVGCSPPDRSKAHLILGNPSNATGDPTNQTNYLMQKPQYSLSYNSKNGTPNWVSWQLNQSWLGNTERQNDFRPDESLPKGWYKVVEDDYRNSGYDRGHVTPSADRNRTVADNSSTFLMTNIVPQTADNNRGPWKQLEEYSRDLVEEGKELYIIAGPDGSKKRIGDRKVLAPWRTWKIIVVLERPGSGVRGVTTKTRVISVIIPNTNNLKSKDWKKYRVSVDEVEKETGYDFLSKVPKSIQDEIERRVDDQ